MATPSTQGRPVDRSEAADGVRRLDNGSGVIDRIVFADADIRRIEPARSFMRCRLDLAHDGQNSKTGDLANPGYDRPTLGRRVLRRDARTFAGADRTSAGATALICIPRISGHHDRSLAASRWHYRRAPSPLTTISLPAPSTWKALRSEDAQVAWGEAPTGCSATRALHGP